ncbi:MAG: 3-deoxy-7-phosphoheptulonate synthase [Planctomycetes bacterium]|nr:3-deoxy-7-phosphoheptulonate synthase [Planctomycetota bacterium]MBU4397978.1 3-deoxy-7-phosphoheptulonate synthase [Planctomycetota bacterium]
MNTWTPDSWQTKPLAQGVDYADRAHLQRTLAELAAMPPLVGSWEIEELKRQLAEAQLGRRFLLQGGDCCERFDDCRPEPIAGKLKILLEMGLILAAGQNRRVIHVGRIAGQFAKPRSAETETHNGVALPSYRGDLINRPAFTAEARAPDPRLLLRGYQRATLTLHYIHGLIEGGFIKTIAGKPLCWCGSCTAAPVNSGRQCNCHPNIDRVEFFTSHEGLHLDYERAQTRPGPRDSTWYDLTAHFPWIGDRTRSIGGAHVEFFRGIANPIGLKVGPTMTPEELLALIDVLNPNDEPGRLTLIHRFGLRRIEKCLPPLVEAVRRCGKTVLWCCDPMHGNTQLTQGGLKTRDFNHVLGELDRAFEIHARLGSVLGGVHFELTGENVTECIGGAGGPSEADLGKAYLSDVDPRLNYEQALEMAASIARRTGNSRKYARRLPPVGLNRENSNSQ